MDHTREGYTHPWVRQLIIDIDQLEVLDDVISNSDYICYETYTAYLLLIYKVVSFFKNKKITGKGIDLGQHFVDAIYKPNKTEINNLMTFTLSVNIHL